MSDNDDPLASHRVHQAISNVETKAHALDLSAMPEATPHAERLREVAAHVRVQVGAATSPLVSPAMFERVAAPADAIATLIEQFDAEQNPAYLEQRLLRVTRCSMRWRCSRSRPRSTRWKPPDPRRLRSVPR